AGFRILTQTVSVLEPFEDIPPALLFRATTEATRQRVGQGIRQLVDRAEDLVNTLTLSEVTVAVPDVTFDFFNLLKVEASDLSATSSAEPGPDLGPELRLQGKVVLPDFFNVTADFTGDNYIGLSAENFVFKGVISAEDIELVPGKWELKEVHIGFDTGP